MMTMTVVLVVVVVVVLACYYSFSTHHPPGGAERGGAGGGAGGAGVAQDASARNGWHLMVSEDQVATESLVDIYEPSRAHLDWLGQSCCCVIRIQSFVHSLTIMFCKATLHVQLCFVRQLFCVLTARGQD